MTEQLITQELGYPSHWRFKQDQGGQQTTVPEEDATLFTGPQASLHPAQIRCGRRSMVSFLPGPRQASCCKKPTVPLRARQSPSCAVQLLRGHWVLFVHDDRRVWCNDFRNHLQLFVRTKPVAGISRIFHCWFRVP